MSNEQNLANTEMSAEDLAWIDKYKDDPEFQEETPVGMADEPYAEDEDGKQEDDEATKQAEEAARLEAEELARKTAEDAAKAATTEAQSAAEAEAAEQKLYADLLAINDKQEELKEAAQAAAKELEAKEKELAELAKTFDAGDLGQAEFDIQKTKVNEAINELKAQSKQLKDSQDENGRLLAETAVKVDEVSKAATERKKASDDEEAKGQQQWNADCNEFLSKKENEVFAKDTDLLDELAGFVTTISQRAINKGITLSNADVLAQARKAVAALHDDIPAEEKPKTTPAKKEQPTIPPTLGRFSAAATPNVNVDDPFSAFEKLSPAERDAALLAIPREQFKRMGRGG